MIKTYKSSSVDSHLNNNMLIQLALIVYMAPHYLTNKNFKKFLV